MPTWLAVFASRIGGFLSGRRQDAECDLEMASHLEMLTDEHIRRGLPPGEARRQAILRFGGPVQIKEQQRERRGLPFVETTMQDIRYGVRTLRKSPAYSLVAIATLAIGIGAGTAVFSVVGAVLLRPLPFAAPDRLVRIYENQPAAPLDGEHRLPGQLLGLAHAEHELRRHRRLRAVQLERQRRRRRIPHRLRRAAGTEGARRQR